MISDDANIYMTAIQKDSYNIQDDIHKNSAFSWIWLYSNVNFCPYHYYTYFSFIIQIKRLESDIGRLFIFEEKKDLICFKIYDFKKTLCPISMSEQSNNKFQHVYILVSHIIYILKLQNVVTQICGKLIVGVSGKGLLVQIQRYHMHDYKH